MLLEDLPPGVLLDILVSAGAWPEVEGQPMGRWERQMVDEAMADMDVFSPLSVCRGWRGMLLGSPPHLVQLLCTEAAGRSPSCVPARWDTRRRCGTRLRCLTHREPTAAMGTRSHLPQGMGMSQSCGCCLRGQQMRHVPTPMMENHTGGQRVVGTSPSCECCWTGPQLLGRTARRETRSLPSRRREWPRVNGAPVAGLVTACTTC
jgi:hypothetical protein